MKQVLCGVLMCCLLCLCSISARADDDVLIPVTIDKGTSLIKLTRTYCIPGADWRRLAEINNLKEPYIIYTGGSISFPDSMLITEKVTAQIASVIGGVFRVAPDGSLQQVKKGERILPGQTLVTEADGFAHLIFPDHKYIRISSNSKFTLTYLLRLVDKSLKAEFFLERGNISLEVKEKLKKHETFNTRTPVSVTGVRGTTFRVKMDNDINTVETLSGTVSLSSAGGSVRVPAGMGTSVKEGERPAIPKALPPAPALPAMKQIYKLTPLQVPAPAVREGGRARMRITSDVAGTATVWAGEVKGGKDFLLSEFADGVWYAFFSAVSSEGFEGAASGPVQFQLRTIPSAPILVRKKGRGGVFFGDTLPLKWLSSQTAVKYRVQIARDTAFTDLLKDEVVQKTDVLFTELPPGKYCVRVAAVARDGFESLWSSIDTVELKEIPSLQGGISPAGKGLLLKWLSLGKDARYDLQVASSKSFDSPLISVEGLEKPEYSITQKLEPGTWLIRVRAVFPGDVKSPWSPTQEMKVPSPSPGWADGAVLAVFSVLLLICI